MGCAAPPIYAVRIKRRGEVPSSSQLVPPRRMPQLSPKPRPQVKPSPRLRGVKLLAKQQLLTSGLLRIWRESPKVMGTSCPFVVGRQRVQADAVALREHLTPSTAI